MSEIQKAIDYCKYQLTNLKEDVNKVPGVFHQRMEEAIKTQECILSALQDRSERKKGCEWCNKGLRFECNLIDSQGNTASVENNVVQTCIADFCPHCGRDLRKPVEK
ncbi:MAG TPA: hypothetical protein VHP31_11815 [Caproicibacter sp.]|nr:hypothetical protein [Caproicibacter sp.]